VIDYTPHCPSLHKSEMTVPALNPPICERGLLHFYIRHHGQFGFSFVLPFSSRSSDSYVLLPSFFIVSQLIGLPSFPWTLSKSALDGYVGYLFVHCNSLSYRDFELFSLPHSPEELSVKSLWNAPFYKH
jgi:hypothetical protein